MAQFVQILFIAFLAVALCAAEVPRSHFLVKRNRFLARQEVEAEPAEVTPYPFADELKPEVPFDEAAATEEQPPNQPDEVYGPPEQEVPVATDDIIPVEQEVPATDEEEEEAIAAIEAAAKEEAAASSRLTAARRVGVSKSSVRPAKLRKPAPAKLRKITPARLQPLFYYVAQ